MKHTIEVHTEKKFNDTAEVLRIIQAFNLRKGDYIVFNGLRFEVTDKKK